MRRTTCWPWRIACQLFLLAGLCAVVSTSSSAISISGAVANHVSKFFAAEVDRFRAEHATSVTYSYQVSRVALDMLSSGGIKFAVTQNTAPNSSLCASHGLLSLPLLVGVGGFYHNVPGISSTPKLDACTVAGVFTGSITMWNDPAIRATNAGVSLPSKAIRVVIREDDGPVPLTLQLLQYIKEQCPAVGGQLPSNYQFPAAFQRVVKIKELVDAIGSTPYAIGYVQASSYPGGKDVAVQNRDGQYVTAASMDSGSFAAALQAPSPSTCWGGVKTTNLPGRTTHPLTFIIYFVAPGGRTSHGPAQLAVSQLAAQLLSPAAQARAATLGFRPLPALLKNQADANGHLLAPSKASGGKLSAGVVAGIVVGAVAGVAAVAALAVLLLRRKQQRLRHNAVDVEGSSQLSKSVAPVPTVGFGNMV